MKKRKGDFSLQESDSTPETKRSPLDLDYVSSSDQSPTRHGVTMSLPVLAEIADLLPDGLVVFDTGFRVVYANAAARRISRIRDEHFHGPTHWEIWPETVGSILEITYRRVMESREPQTMPVYYYEPFDVWLAINVLPVEAGICAYYRDVTAAHRAAVARDAAIVELDRQHREAEAVYRVSPIGMALYDSESLRLLRINDRQAEIFDIDPAKAIGMRFEELVDGVLTGLPLIRRAAAGERIENFPLEGILARRPGEYRYWSVNYSPVFDEDGEVQAVATATVEITQQKRAETALIQAEKLAVVGRMAASIAHEINNPLESVTNLLFLASSETQDPALQHYLELADQELRRVSIIANQTLRFHKQPSTPREVSGDDLFATVLSLYEGRLRNSGIRVEHRHRSAARIACFEGDIRQVLHNLISNAIDAMPRGGRLLLRTRESTDWTAARLGHPTRGLTLTVADTGVGIEPAAQRHIFEAFFTTKGMAGTGLGLWISSGIMQRHHGRLRMRSRTAKPRGTVFTVFLPFDGAPAL